MFVARQRRRGQGTKKSSKQSTAIGPVAERLEDRTLFNSLAWSVGPALPQALGNAATLGSYGLVYVVGGTTATGSSTANAYSYDPSAGLWSTALPLNQATAGAGIGYTGNPGPVVVNSQGLTQWKYASEIFVYGGKIGGQSSASVLNWVNSNNIDGDSVATPSMSTPRANMAYTTDVATGDLYAIGGINGSTALASAEVYDPTADAWSSIAPLPQAVSSAAAVDDGVGHIFVFGGNNSAGQPLDTVYRYTIATGSWDQMGAMPFAASGVGAVDVAYGQIYVVGGKTASGPTSGVEWYNPVLDQWNDETPLPSPVYGAAVATDAYGNIDVIGGFDASGKATSTFYTSPVGPAPQGLPATPTIQFANTWDYYNGAPEVVTPTAIGSDGFTTVAGSYTLTYNGSPTPPTDAGTYNLVATFTSADPNYTDTAATGTLYIAPANPTLTLTGGGTILWDGNPHPATATVVGIDGVTPPAGTIVITYNGSTTPPVNGGSYSVVATFTSADSNYANATATTKITIPDPTIPTGVKSVGVSPTSFSISWNPVPTPVSEYIVYGRTVAHSPRGSGATIYYTAVAATTGTSVTFSVGAGITTYYYVVASVSSTGVVSPYSAIVGAQVAYAPTIYGMLVGGGYVSWGTVEAGQTITASLSTSANPPPTYQMLSGPSTMSINPSTGVITYSPTSAEVGYTSATFQATNSQGSAKITTQFHVLAVPTVVVTGGYFTYDGNTHGATAVAYGSDGVTPIAGTFSILYNGGSTAPYAMAGTWPVSVQFTSSDPNYGNASGSGVVVITPATPTLTLNAGPFTFDGTPQGPTAIAIGADGITPVAGTMVYLYNGSSTPPTDPGTYGFGATFISSDPNYQGVLTGGTFVINPPSSAPSNLSSSAPVAGASTTSLGPPPSAVAVPNTTSGSAATAPANPPDKLKTLSQVASSTPPKRLTSSRPHPHAALIIHRALPRAHQRSNPLAEDKLPSDV